MRPCGLFLLCGAALAWNSTSDETASSRSTAPRLVSPTSVPARLRPAPCSACNCSGVEGALDWMTASLEPTLVRRFGSRDAAKRMLSELRTWRRPESPRPQLHGGARPLPFISAVCYGLWARKVPPRPSHSRTEVTGAVYGVRSSATSASSRRTPSPTTSLLCTSAHRHAVAACPSRPHRLIPPPNTAHSRAKLESRIEKLA